MPAYELCVIYRLMAKPELAGSMKRTAEVLFEHGCVLKKIENLGFREIPNRILAHQYYHYKGNYIMYHYESSPKVGPIIKGLFRSDTDIVKTAFNKINKYEQPEECTYEEEHLPPAYRKDVQEMIEKAKKELYVHPYTFSMKGKVDPFS